ncbi:MAG: hypothetical protein AAFV38_07230 [Pseudomonadota bacterium]
MLAERLFVVPRTLGLGLDLEKLEGGGAAPAEFNGLTPDMRDVHCRYRGGQLSVYVADQPGGDPVREGVLQYEEHVGPSLHGAMTLGQVCHLAGLSIGGTRPDLPDATELATGALRDLRPGTSHYQAWFSLTPGTAQSWLMAQDIVLRMPGSDLTGSFHGVRCRSSDDVRGEWFRIVLGGTGTESSVRDILDRGAALTDEGLVVNCSYSGFIWPEDLEPRTPPRAWSTLPAPMPRMAGHDPDCVTRTLMLEATLQPGDGAGMALLEAFDAALDTAFPPVRMLAYDLRNQQRRSALDRQEAMDPAVVDWVKAGADRWQWITNVGSMIEPDLVGFRPAPRQSLPGQRVGS